PALGPFRRPASEAELSVRPGRRTAGADRARLCHCRRSRGATEDLGRGRRDRSLSLRDGRAGTRDALGRAGLWAQLRPRRVPRRRHHDFNMGAMENKGLNIFNAKYLLADPDSSTDDEYRHVEAVVAHEYFHNWSGNRVTCRDWFQLSLKEGLTVYREQSFSADMNSASLKRIEDVSLLRRA